MFLLEVIKISFMRNALMVLLATSSLLSYLGVYVVLKRIVFVGIAIAQIASLGYALGILLNFDPQTCSLFTSLLGAMLFSFHAQEKIFPRESIIGLGYCLASSLGIIFIAKSAAAEASVLNLLFGNILMVSLNKVYFIAALCLCIFIFYYLFNKEITFIAFDGETAKAQGLNARALELFFYLSLAIAISAAISIIGALLTFSFLLIPALCGLRLCQRLANVFKGSIIAGIFSSIAGLYISYYCDLPTGPTIVATSIALFGIVVVLKKLL